MTQENAAAKCPNCDSHFKDSRNYLPSNGRWICNDPWHDWYREPTPGPWCYQGNLVGALRGLMYLTDQGREGGLIFSRADGKPMTNGDQDIIDHAYLTAERLLANLEAGL